MTRLQKFTRLFVAAAVVVALLFFVGSLSAQSKGKGKPPKNDLPPVWYRFSLIELALEATNAQVHDMNNVNPITGSVVVNDSDVVVVGTADKADGDQFAFVYTINGGMRDVNTLLTDEDIDDLVNDQGESPDWIAIGAYKINKLGQIAGRARKGIEDDYEYRGFLFDPYAVSNRFKILPMVDEAVGYGRPQAMNNLGDIVARVSFEDSDHLFLFSYDTETEVYTPTDLSDIVPGLGVSGADINDWGQIVVSSGGGLGTILGGHRLSLPTYKFFPNLKPTAINNVGTFTGEAQAKTRNSTPVFRYLNELEILHYGKKELPGIGVDINSSGDVGSRIPSSINTTHDNGTLFLEDIIHPADVVEFMEDTWRLDLRAIGERDDSGFFPIIVRNLATYASGLEDESFLLLPESPNDN